jgi:hypothetical protein
VSGGVYERGFTNGKAIVNPTGAPVTVALGGTYVRPDGTTTTSVVLGAYQSEILTAG